MKFADDEKKAKSLPEKERREMYKTALEYLQEFLKAARSAQIDENASSGIKLALERLHGSMAKASFEVQDLNLAKGERSIVLEHLKLVRNFYPAKLSKSSPPLYKEMSGKQNLELDRFESEIKTGKIPTGKMWQ
jgi:hypothetical protein